MISTAACGLMIPISACGQQNEASAPRSFEFIVMNAPPKALRRITVTRGELAAANARSSSAPWLITPAASCRLPGMNPGVSTSTSMGMPKASQVRTNFLPFCEACDVDDPAAVAGLVGDDRHGVSLQPGEADDHVARPPLGDLAEATRVDQPPIRSRTS